jgi:N-acetylneuraminic acid mutarotase
MALMCIPMALSAEIAWRDLPPLPQALGGQFVGVIDDRLVVAGGSHWDGVPRPWNGGKKIWVDTIYTLGRGESAWRMAGRLPHKMGYGVAISLRDAMLCIGGQTPDGNLATTYRLRLRAGKISIDELAPLPHTAANMAGALMGDTIFVAAGQESPSSLTALRTFWSLSLSAAKAAWKELPAWPGPGVIMPTLTATRGALYLVGGSELTGDPGPPLGRRFLSDAFRYRTGAGWDKLPNLPRPAQAAFAVADGDDVLLIGGSDGALAPRELEIKDNHPGFNRDIFRYSAKNGRWMPEGTMPASLVTSGIVRWGDEWVIAGGEDRPGHRSARVIAGRKK